MTATLRSFDGMTTTTSEEHTMTDSDIAARGRMTLPVLWSLLGVSAVCNMVTSTIGVNPLVGIGFGLLTLALGGGLIAQYRKDRRR
ncbi:hypothetical protein E1292_36150 [Nonomuraea deserti]|uniref:Uncharacterized protein n=1 Tax=Nonomuraea deserti TaxID=1848322 RepID=A0A4R4UYT4_9ACTN|nr:hypothetical protein [Nonomuraea deserti]TDC97908.1 hypothetical protein E1292_36150 [Nonomuraea deserti]